MNHFGTGTGVRRVGGPVGLAQLEKKMLLIEAQLLL